MPLSMYQASVPAFIRQLNSLDNILAKAEAHCETRRIDGAVLPASRLYPDMFPLARQVQIATDNAKGCGARLAGIEPPRFEDSETTFDELRQRVRKTVDFLLTLREEQFEGSETRDIVLVFPNITLKYTGMAYLLEFALPNFYFHVTTAYNILRHCGVELGKRDFLGG